MGRVLRSTLTFSRRGVDRPHGLPPDDPERILLVQLDHLGDAILTTAMLPSLRRRYPNAAIEVLAGAWNREVFEAAPEVDRVHVSATSRFARGRWRRLAWIGAILWWGIRLRRRRFDLAIDVRGEFPLALVLWLCGARRRVGWAAGGGGFLLTDSVLYAPDRPEVESRGAILSTLGIESPPLRPRFTPSPAARRKMSRWLAEVGRPLAVFHLGAGTRAKQWPADHWRRLLGRTVVELGSHVVLVGGDDGRRLGADVLRGEAWPGVSDWTGRLTVDELAALLEEADVLVGGDSGPAHLAAAVDAPVVVLFSGTNCAEQWRPHGADVAVLRHAVDCSPCHRTRCPRPGHPCMTGLAPEVALEEVARVLARRRNRVGWDKRSAGPPTPQSISRWAGASLVPPYGEHGDSNGNKTEPATQGTLRP
jgi:heptosyltransferase-2